MSENTLPSPLGHLVLVKIPSVEHKSSGGILLSTMLNSTERNRQEDGKQIGHVVELGPNAYKAFGDGEPWVKKGDKVFFKRYAGVEYRTTNEDGSLGDLYRAVNDDDIFLKLPEGDAQ